MRPAVLLVMVLGCHSAVRPPLAPVEVQLEGAVHATRCGDVTAVWPGKVEGPGPDWFFAQGLVFRFRDGREVPWKEGELVPHHRSFDVFSPDCAWVLLATSSEGPYQLIETARLSETPAPRLVGVPDAGVHSDQQWLSTTQFEFTTERLGAYRYDVGQQRLWSMPRDGGVN